MPIACKNFFTFHQKFTFFHSYSFIQHIFIGFLLNLEAIAVNQTSKVPVLTLFIFWWKKQTKSHKLLYTVMVKRRVQDALYKQERPSWRNEGLSSNPKCKDHLGRSSLRNKNVPWRWGNSMCKHPKIDFFFLLNLIEVL